MRLTSIAAAVLLLVVLMWLLIIAKNLMIPFAIAVVLWYLFNGIKRGIGNVRIGTWVPPVWLQTVGSSILMLLGAFLVVELIVVHVNDISDVLPRYRTNLSKLLEPLFAQLGIEAMPDFTKVLDEFNLSNAVSTVLNELTSVVGNFFMIVIYFAFLLIEQGSFRKKLTAIFVDPKRLQQVNETISHIQASIQKYIALKSFTSLLTGLLSYFVLVAVDVDFALFWAFLIFLLNFIPTVGSLIATSLPALLTLVQFDTFTPFFIVLFGVGAIQLLVGNYIEPKLMGASLNVSPLVVLLSLTVWGSIWGVMGMFLCVPITVITIIICAQFKATQFIAILLSGNGEIAQGQ